jgi:hypothetical protein
MSEIGSEAKVDHETPSGSIAVAHGPTCPGGSTDALRRSTPLTVYETLRFPPVLGHAELARNVGSATFQQLDAVGVGWERQFEGVVCVVAVTVSVD